MDKKIAEETRNKLAAILDAHDISWDDTDEIVEDVMDVILALIEQREKPKDIALGLAKDLLESHGYDAKNSSVIREIDAALKEER